MRLREPWCSSADESARRFARFRTVDANGESHQSTGVFIQYLDTAKDLK
jgi:hypothetical protein